MWQNNNSRMDLMEERLPPLHVSLRAAAEGKRLIRLLFCAGLAQILGYGHVTTVVHPRIPSPFLPVRSTEYRLGNWKNQSVLGGDTSENNSIFKLGIF